MSFSEDGQRDMLKEYSILEKINEDIDQLASEARDCGTLAPRVKDILDIAWYISEYEMREADGLGSCGHGLKPVSRPYCPCCAHFTDMRTLGEKIRRLL